MTTLRVTVVPVGLRPLGGDDQSGRLGVSTLKREGAWLSASITDPSETLQMARRLLDGAVPQEVAAGDLENAGVEYSSGSPNLLLTAVLPISAAELSDNAEDWPLLAPWVGDAEAKQRTSMLRPLEPIQGAMVAYWRGQLIQTTAALDFLPKYFTMHQARSVYASVWGERQQDGNFQRWLGSAEDVSRANVCKEVEGGDAREEIQDEFAQRLAASATGISVAMVKKQWDPKVVGTSSAVSGLGGLATLIPAAAVAGAVVGATVAYQRARSAGRPPRWYSRVVNKRIGLKTWYPVRPPAAALPPLVIA